MRLWSRWPFLLCSGRCGCLVLCGPWSGPGAGEGVSALQVGRSALRADFPAVLGQTGRGRTRYALRAALKQLPRVSSRSGPVLRQARSPSALRSSAPHRRAATPSPAPGPASRVIGRHRRHAELTVAVHRTAREAGSQGAREPGRSGHARVFNDRFHAVVAGSGCAGDFGVGEERRMDGLQACRRTGLLRELIRGGCLSAARSA